MNDVAIKWYKKLMFPKECDNEFYNLAKEKDISCIDTENAVEILNEKKDPGLSLIYFLSRIDAMQEYYNSLGIPEKYFNAGIKRLKDDACGYKNSSGQLGIVANSWSHGFICGNKLNRLFRIGRLDFSIEKAVDHWHGGGDVKHGDPIAAVHIPGGEPLDSQACLDSFDEAEEFIQKYYPEHNLTCFACGSWLLDETVDKFTGEKSNIRNFRNMFEIYKSIESDSAIGHVFHGGFTRENIADAVPKNSFQQKMKDYIISGGKLYVVFGKRNLKNK